MKYYSIGEFAKLIGKTIQTLRNWDSKGVLKPHHVTSGGTRYYSQEQLNYFLGLKPKNDTTKKVIGYCRVSSHKQKDDLERQIDNVKTYMYAKGYQFEIIDNTEKMEEQELVEDLIQIVTAFSCRLQGKRANKAKKMIKELLEDDKSKES